MGYTDRHNMVRKSYQKHCLCGSRKTCKAPGLCVGAGNMVVDPELGRLWSMTVVGESASLRICKQKGFVWPARAPAECIFEAKTIKWWWLHVLRQWYYRSETMHDLPSGDDDLMFRDDKISIVRQSKICSETKHNMFWDNGFAFRDITHPILRQWALRSEMIHFAFRDNDILWSATLELLVWS